jgi:RNA polymerase sigma factor (sigma-70 family)
VRMVSKLTNEHYKMIKAFSRKITKGINSDDLSQHVILKLLQKDTQFINGLIDREEFKYFIWRFVQNMQFRSGSSYNREEHGTSNKDGRLNTIELTELIIAEDSEEDSVDFTSIIDKAELTDIERMYLNAYKDANCNYTTCSSNLDISTSTISKYVKQAINKCKNSQ